MMRKYLILKVAFLISILLTGAFAGIISQEQKTAESENIFLTTQLMDQPSILPDWNDGDYHDYYATREKLIDFNDKFPGLVYVFSIGKSILNKDIWCIRITNENNNSKKYSCLYDGCIHGNEWEGGEACLYFAEYLLINFGKNETIISLLNKSEVYIVPLVNPDGRQKDERHNHNSIDPNRNFDVHFGRFRGGSLRLGKWFPI